jgi:hypothetical protein
VLVENHLTAKQLEFEAEESRRLRDLELDLEGLTLDTSRGRSSYCGESKASDHSGDGRDDRDAWRLDFENGNRLVSNSNGSIALSS